MNKQIFLTIITLLFINCANNTIMIHPDYQDIVIRGAVMNVESVDSTVIIINCPDDLEDDLGQGDVNQVFRNYFADKFPKAVKEISNLRDVRYSNKKGIAESSISKTNFTMKFDRIDISVGYTYIYGGGSSKYLEFSNVYYKIFDDRNNREIIKGETKVSKSGVLGIKVTTETWDQVVIALARNIISQSPFYESGNIHTDQIINSDNTSRIVTKNETKDPSEINDDKILVYKKNNIFDGNLKLVVAGNMNFHSRDQDSQDPNIPDNLEVLEERPSVAKYYNNGPGFCLGLSYGFKNRIPTNRNDGLIIGLNYYRHTATSKNSDIAKVLGNNLTMNRIIPFFGYTAEIDTRMNWFCNVGYSFRQYSGSGSFYLEGQKITVDSRYEPANGIFLGLGANIRISPVYPIILKPGISIDFGSVYFKNAKYNSGGTLTLNESLKLSDVLAEFSVGMVYEFDTPTIFH